MRRVLTLAVLIMVMMGLATVAFAKDEESTLDRVLKRGKLVVGTFRTLPPWGFVNEKQEVVGLDVDLAKEMATALGVQLELVDTPGPARIPAILSGKVDVIIAVLSITPERAQSIGFSLPYACEQSLFLGRIKDGPIRSFNELAGKRVSVERGSTQDIWLTENAPKGTQILRFDGPGEVYLALRQGKSDLALGGSPPVLAEVSRSPELLEVKGEPVAPSYIGMGFRRDDYQWKNWIDSFIICMFGDGKIQKLHERWFGKYMRFYPNW